MRESNDNFEGEEKNAKDNNNNQVAACNISLHISVKRLLKNYVNMWYVHPQFLETFSLKVIGKYWNGKTGEHLNQQLTSFKLI